MKRNRKVIAVIICFGLLLTLGGCGMMQTLNLVNCKYGMAGVSDITWAGINLTDIKSQSDLTPTNLAKAGKALLKGDFTLNCKVNVDVKNETQRPAKLAGYDYELLLDGVQMITGNNMNNSFMVNPGQTSRMAVPITIDIKEIVKEDGIGNVINFVRNLKDCGNGTESKVKVKLTPYMAMGEKNHKMAPIVLSKTFQ